MLTPYQIFLISITAVGYVALLLVLLPPIRK